MFHLDKKSAQIDTTGQNLAFANSSIAELSRKILSLHGQQTSSETPHLARDQLCVACVVFVWADTEEPISVEISDGIEETEGARFTRRPELRLSSSRQIRDAYGIRDLQWIFRR